MNGKRVNGTREQVHCPLPINSTTICAWEGVPKIAVLKPNASKTAE